MRVMLTLADREEISRGLAEGLEYKQIGVLIGRNPSVVSREVVGHGGRGARPPIWRRRVAVSAEGVGGRAGPGLREVVRERLRLGWSPASIAGRLVFDYPDDQAYRVSHEAIYQWIYAQPVSDLAPGADPAADRPHRPPWRRPSAPAPRIREPPLSTNARPRSRTGRSPVTGKVTWSSARLVRARGDAGRTHVAVRGPGPADWPERVDRRGCDHRRGRDATNLIDSGRS